MRLSHVTSSKIVGVALLAGLWALACSSDSGDNAAAGGSTAAGGTTGTGGTKSGTGGTKSASTTAAKTGGTSSVGGTAATGGTSPASTTAKTGGAPGTSTGGVASTLTTSTSTGHTGGVNAGGTGGVNAGGAGGVGGVMSTTTGGHTGDAGPDAGSICATEGCITLYVPFTQGKTGTLFDVDFGASPLLDLSDVVITARVYVDTATSNGSVRLYATNNNPPNYSNTYGDVTAGSFTTLEGGWHDITLDFNAVAALDGGTGFDKSKVRWIGFDVATGDAGDGGTVAPATVYVDWIKFNPATAHTDITFDGDALDGFVGNTYQAVKGSSLNGTVFAN